MTRDKAQRLAKLLNQLTEMLMTVAICTQEIRSAVHAELDGVNGDLCGRSEPLQSAVQGQRPILDVSTLCVSWDGRSIHLGNTIGFRFLDRIARRPNQYVTHTDLIRDAWGEDEKNIAVETVRSVVCDLRGKLREGGMDALAAAIHGHKGHYILTL